MNNIGMYVDMSGQRVIGEIISGDATTHVKLKNPIIVTEVLRENGGRPVVDLRFSPEMHTFDIEEMTIKWCRNYQVNTAICEAYSRHICRIKAARQGIEIVQSLPENVEH